MSVESARKRGSRIVLLTLALMGAAAVCLVLLSTSQVRVVRDLKALSRGVKLLSDEGLVLQSGAADCGIAALDMALRRFQPSPGWRAFARNRLAVRKAGLSIGDLIDISLAAGVAASASRMSAADLRRFGGEVVLFTENHLVYAEEIAADHVLIADPALGRFRLSYDELEAVWNGVTLKLQATQREHEVLVGSRPTPSEVR